MSNSVSTFVGYLMLVAQFNPSLEEGVHIFLKDINSKVNVIARLGFELAHHDISFQHFSANLLLI